MAKKKNQIRRSTTSIMDLPESLFICVLLHLSARSIISCKSVSKGWRSLISSREFAKLHLAKRKTSVLIRDIHCTRYSRTLYLMEAENFSDFDFSKCWCQPCNSGNFDPYLCDPTIILNDKLKIPLRNTEAITDLVHDYDPEYGLCYFGTSVKCVHESIKKQLEIHRYNIANSCDGLLFLIEPSLRNSVVICNPITGEFISYHVPTNLDFDNQNFVLHGLGFGPKKNQYKMVRICAKWTEGSTFRILVQIRTIGSNCWKSQVRNIAPLPISSLNLHSPVCFRGVLYWVFTDNSDDSNCILLCLDLDDESICFHKIRISPSFKDGKGHSLRMGILEGCLCVYDNNNTGTFGDVLEIWMMKEYAAWDSWTKVFSRNVGNENNHCRGVHIPICYTNNGGLVIFNARDNEFVYYDHLERLLSNIISAVWLEKRFEAIVHTPSFISLKDIDAPGSDHIHNVNFRCGNVELEEERDPPSFYWRPMLGND